MTYCVPCPCCHAFVAGDRFVAALRLQSRTVSITKRPDYRSTTETGRAPDASAPAQPDPDRADRWLPATHARIIRSLIMQLACWRWWPVQTFSSQRGPRLIRSRVYVADRWRWIERPAAKETAEQSTTRVRACDSAREADHAMLRLQPTQGPAGRHRERNPPPIEEAPGLLLLFAAN